MSNYSVNYRKKLSGAEYRKRKAEESLKKESLLKKIPKISNFLTNPTKFISNDNDLQASGLSAVSILMHKLIYFFFNIMFKF